MEKNKAYKLIKTPNSQSIIQNDEMLDDPTYVFDETNFLPTQYQYKVINLPRMQAFTCYEMKKVKRNDELPSIKSIYSFMKYLYDKSYV